MASSRAATGSNTDHDRSWGLPLLAKDLTELAARARTYQIRTGYALAVMLVCLYVLASHIQSFRFSSVAALGMGQPVLSALILWQELGLYLVLPVLACCTLTVEKERKTLDLLLITNLGPWTIVFEKFLSVLVLAINYLVLSLPVFAVSYALGGIESQETWTTVLEMMLTAVRISAVGVMCSAAFERSSRALAMNYLLLVVVCCFEQACQYLLLWIFRSSNFVVPPLPPDFWLFRMFRSNIFLTAAISWPLLTRMALGSLSSLFFSSMFLVAARWALAPSEWHRLRRRAAGYGDTLSGAEVLLPRSTDFTDPVSWAELPREGLAQWRRREYLRAIVPTVVILLILRLVFGEQGFRIAGALVSGVIWLLVIVRICTQACTVIVEERIHQTLDVLRCTPLTAKSIVRQKMERVWRTVDVARAALIACVAVRFVSFPSLPYATGSALMIWMYPVVLAWLGLWCGLTARTGATALLKTFLALAGLSFLPLYCAPMIFGVSMLPLLVATEAVLLSERGLFNSFDLMPLFIVAFVGTFLGQYSLVWFLRRWIMNLSDFRLRTNPEFPDTNLDFPNSNLGQYRRLDLDD